MAERKKKTAVLISGRGSNLAALIEAAEARDFPARIALVVSNRPDAAGLQLARDKNIPAVVVDDRQCDTRTEFEMHLDAALREAEIELICLAGFMRILSRRFVEGWHDRILNIHPSLLPLFPGLRTHERAIAAGMKVHGATVHFVRADVDSGPIVTQEEVPIWPGDSPETLAERVLKVEHRIYPLALKLVASGRAKVIGDRVTFEGGEAAEPARPSRMA
jgi:phosphoribosylglycinamide formyltransferase-1